MLMDAAAVVTVLVCCHGMQAEMILVNMTNAAAAVVTVLVCCSHGHGMQAEILVNMTNAAAVVIDLVCRCSHGMQAEILIDVMIDFPSVERLGGSEVVNESSASASVFALELAKGFELVITDGDGTVKHDPSHDLVATWCCKRSAVMIKAVFVDCFEELAEVDSNWHLDVELTFPTASCSGHNFRHGRFKGAKGLKSPCVRVQSWHVEKESQD